MCTLNINGMRMNKNLIEIDPWEKKSVRLKVSVRTNIELPKTKSNKTVIFHINLNAHSEEGDSVSIQTETVFLFEFNEFPESFDEAFSEQCSQIALPKVSEAIDKTVEIMGYNKLDLYNNIHKQEE